MSLIPWPILPMPSRVLVCEWATAGLALLERSSALHREGRAMLVALVEDLARIDDVSVRALISDDLGLEAEIPDPVRVPVVRAHAERALLELAPAFDGVVLIAPETDGIHALLSRQILRAGGRVLGSTPAGIARAADKLLLARRLARFGVPALPAELLAAPSAVIERLGRDLVLKPRRGAGAEGVRRIASDDVPRLASGSHRGSRSRRIVTPFCEGTAASILVLVGRESHVPLLPTLQVITIDPDGHLAYRGSEAPLHASLVERASRLASATVSASTGLRGVVGVDLILGERDEDDRVVEVNPRFTTSWLALRRLARENIAERFLECFTIGAPRAIEFESSRIRLHPDGTIAPESSMALEVSPPHAHDTRPISS